MEKKSKPIYFEFARNWIGTLPAAFITGRFAYLTVIWLDKKPEGSWKLPLIATGIAAFHLLWRLSNPYISFDGEQLIIKRFYISTTKLKIEDIQRIDWDDFKPAVVSQKGTSYSISMYKMFRKKKKLKAALMELAEAYNIEFLDSSVAAKPVTV